jgi:hypothetical protein
LESQDDVTLVIHLLRTISRNDSSNFISSGKIVSPAISALLEVNAGMDICMLLWRLLTHDLIGLLANSSPGMISEENVMELSENVGVKIWISVSTDIGGFLGVIDEELGIDRLITLLRQERTLEVVEFSMNGESPWARVVESTFIKLDTHRSKCDSTIVLTTMFDKARGGIHSLKLSRPLLERWNANLALQATCTKARIYAGGVGEFFTHKMWGMAVGTLNVERTKRIDSMRLCIWMTTKRNWKNWSLCTALILCFNQLMMFLLLGSPSLLILFMVLLSYACLLLCLLQAFILLMVSLYLMMVANLLLLLCPLKILVMIYL